MFRNTRIVLTGGHLSPLLAVVEVLPKNTKILVIGRKHALEGDSAFSLEYQTIINRGIAFKSITAGRWQRRLTKHTIFSLLKFPYGLIQSFIFLREFKPNVILSFGGYVSLPVALVGFMLNIPLVLHEQTLEGGVANRFVSLFAKKICISWESSRKFFPKSRTILTGNPIRKFHPPVGGSNFQFPISDEKIALVYITGGSTGSHAINTLIEGCLEKLLANYKVIHQTGGSNEFNDFDRLEKLKNSLPLELKKRYFLTKFIEPSLVGGALNIADLVISRSGINTVTELLFFEKPCLLIPLPFSQNNEQIKNATFLKKTGLGEILDQKKIISQRLYEQIVFMVRNIDNYRKKGKLAKKLIEKEAGEKIISVLYNVICEKEEK